MGIKSLNSCVSVSWLDPRLKPVTPRALQIKPKRSGTRIPFWIDIGSLKINLLQHLNLTNYSKSLTGAMNPGKNTEILSFPPTSAVLLLVLLHSQLPAPDFHFCWWADSNWKTHQVRKICIFFKFTTGSSWTPSYKASNSRCRDPIVLFCTKMKAAWWPCWATPPPPVRGSREKHLAAVRASFSSFKVKISISLCSTLACEN